MSLSYEDRVLRENLNAELLPRLHKDGLEALSTLLGKSGAGSEFTGWLSLPEQSPESLSELSETAREIHDSGDLLVCIGIGGSYLGAKAVISALWPHSDRIRFAGHHLSPYELSSLLNELENRDFYINVISKSGTTTEPGVVFRILKNLAEKKYGPKTSRRIIATTDGSRGALKTLAESSGYRSYVIPDDVGGRFSVLTPVGLLPILAAGADLKKILRGASDALHRYTQPDEANISLRYAVNRQALRQSGKAIEILANFEPRLHFMSEWWKQLYGESEGKNGLGLFPASVDFTTDLHSMGQWIQDGVRNILETFVMIRKYPVDLNIPSDAQNLDKLNYLAGRTLSEVNEKAYLGTLSAHQDGGVPVSSLFLDHLEEEHLFHLFVMFEIAVAISGYMQKINPFDQPGVEAYKSNMFRLLGKPG